MAALYRISNGSLLLMMVMHAAANNMGSLVSGRTPGATDPLSLHASTMAWLITAALWVGAAGFLGLDVARRRFRPHRGTTGSGLPCWMTPDSSPIAFRSNGLPGSFSRVFDSRGA